MEEILHYLRLKNQYYEKFYNLTVKFIEKANRDEWDEIAYFVDNRERILNIIRSFDSKLSKIFYGLGSNRFIYERYRSTVKDLLKQREDLGRKIITLDLELISKLEDVKSETIRELKHAMETTQQVGSFSGHAPSRKPVRTA